MASHGRFANRTLQTPTADGWLRVTDIDGTLVDTNYQHALAWYMAFRQHDLHLPVWQIHRHIGMGGDQLITAVAGERAEAEQEVAGAVEVFTSIAELHAHLADTPLGEHEDRMRTGASA